MRRGEDLAAHYASADVFLFPSMTETFGNVTVEAMASGLAVVAYDYAAAREHLVHDDNGVLVPYGQAAVFENETARLAGDAQRVRRLGGNARRTAERIDWDQINEQFAGALARYAALGS